MTTMNNIRTALETPVTGITGMPSGIAWENFGQTAGGAFSPTTGVEWVRVTLVPASQRPAAISPAPQIRNDGGLLFQINWPEAAGTADAEALADNIRNTYTTDDVYTSDGTNVRFRWAERIGRGVNDPPWYVVVVNIQWYAYTAN